MVVFFDSTIKDINLNFKPEKIDVISKGMVLNNEIQIDAILKNNFTPPYVVEDLNLSLVDLNINKIADAVRDIEADSARNISSFKDTSQLDLSRFIINNANIKANKIAVRNINADSFSANLKLSDKEEQEQLNLLVEVLNNIESSENTKIDYKYFAEHIKELIDQYSLSKQLVKGALWLPVVNMENCTKYDYVYFPMFEDNKYPRVLSLGFPFTSSIVNILDELGVGLQKNQEMAYHLKMSRHIFKNVFSFVNKQITFTYTAKENGTDIGLSIYAYDIFKTINREISFKLAEGKKQKECLEHRELIFKDAHIKEVNLN